MRLTDVLGFKKKLDFDIDFLTDDSRLVTRGSVFVCLPDAGEKQKQYIEKALDAGAAAVITAEKFSNDKVITVESPAECLIRWAKFKFPKQPKTVVGVTGTNGKTSVAWFYNKLMNAMGVKAASVGTLGVYVNDDLRFETGYTSPTALKLHEILHDLAEEGVEAVCLEVSSHALTLKRVDGVEFKAAGFTNLTPDHRDFHGSMESYAAAKGRLFAEVLPEKAGAVVNILRPESWPMAAMAKQRGLNLITAGVANAELVVKVLESKSNGILVNIRHEKVNIEAKMKLVGGFQAENLAVTLGLVAHSGISLAKITKALPSLVSAPGRMEVFHAKDKAVTVVDYAHTPDALATVLQAIKPQVQNDLWVVFGCGGNRDVSKRPAMGKIAAEFADKVVVTDDNPRFENADDIREQIMVACKDAENIGDRESAIRFALKHAGVNDTIVVAGKGPENGQYVNGDVIDYNERAVVQKLLQE